MKPYLLLALLFFVSGSAFSQGNYRLIAHWDFNGSANDISGNGLNGVVSGATLAAGYLGIASTAYHFNGSGDHIDVPYNSLMNVDSSFAICVLIKPMGFYPGNCQGNFILTRGVEYSSDYYMVGYDDGAYDHACSLATPDHQVFYSSVPGNYLPPWYPGNTLIDTGTWYCVVLSYDGDTINLYIDGVKLKSLAMHKVYSPGTDGIGIGYNPTRVSDYPYWINGEIDDIRLYNRSLSDAEAALYCDSVKGMEHLFVNPLVNIKTEIAVYPNPTNSRLTVAASEKINTVAIINFMGQVIYSQECNAEQVQLNVADLPPGLYFVKINGTEVRKFVKQ